MKRILIFNTARYCVRRSHFGHAHIVESLCDGWVASRCVNWHRKTIQLVRQIEHPYPLSALTMAIGIQLFENQADTEAFIAHQRHLSSRLKAILQQYASPHMTIYPSETNFVLTAGPQAMALGRHVEQHGFLPRFYNDPSEATMAGFVRYSIATEAQLDRFEQVVKEWSERHDISN